MLTLETDRDAKAVSISALQDGKAALDALRALLEGQLSDARANISRLEADKDGLQTALRDKTAESIRRGDDIVRLEGVVSVLETEKSGLQSGLEKTTTLLWTARFQLAATAYAEAASAMHATPECYAQPCGVAHNCSCRVATSAGT